jgi:sugar lactone lactonase YvrE
MKSVLGVIAVACVGSIWGQTYKIQTIAGGVLPINVAGIAASLGNSIGVAADAEGNLYIACQDYGLILRLDAGTQVLSAVAGNGKGGFRGDGGPAIEAGLSSPSLVILDTEGDLYISGSGRVRKVSNGIITTEAGTGYGDFSGDGGPATSAQFDNPSGLAVDTAGNLYIADFFNNRVRKVSGGIITTVAGNGTPGFSGDGGPATSAQLSFPRGLAVDAAGDLYIADAGNERIRKVSNGIISTVAGGGSDSIQRGDGGPAVGATLFSTEGVLVGPDGNLYITEMARVRKVSNGVITTVAGNVSFGFSGDNGPATSANLSSPTTVAMDAAGNLYFVDAGRVRKVMNGTITTVAGNGTGFGGDNGPATSAQLNSPEGIGLDAAGNVYFADAGNNRVREISNGTITTVAGNGSSNGPAGIGGLAINASLQHPGGVAVDAYDGALYVGLPFVVWRIFNGIITKFAGGGIGFGGDGGPATGASLFWRAGLAVDPAGGMYIADTGNNRIRKVNNGIITTVAGNGAFGFSGDGGAATGAGLNFPWAVAADIGGTFYIADAGNFRIRKVSNGIITTYAGTGNSGSGGDGGAAKNAELGFPTGIALDSLRNVYITDGDRVRKVSGGVITTIAGGGSSFAENITATDYQLSLVSGIVLDASGNVYVTDSGSNRVHVLTPSGRSCGYAVTPVNNNIHAIGGGATVKIQTTEVCQWAVQSLPDWITLSGSAIGTGVSSVTVAAAPNIGPARSAEISIAGQTVTVNQEAGALVLNTGGVVNAASYTASVAPGSIVSVYGIFGLPAPIGADVSPLPAALGGVSLQFSGAPAAPLFFASAFQVNAQVPWELGGQSQATVSVKASGQISGLQPVNIASYAPGVFAMNGQGTG